MAHAQQPEIVEGKVVDNHLTPIAGVEVTVVGQATHAMRVAQTNAAGRYVATFRDTEGSYAISFRKVGYAAFARTVQRAGLSNIIVVPDAVLTNSLTTLQPIVASANKMQRVPARGEIRGVSSVEANTLGNSIFTADPSDLNALISLLPGVLPVGDSDYSVLGARPTQNGTTVDGASFPGSSLPRDAVARSSLVTATFDVSKGQFAGGQNVISLKSGAPYFAATVRGQLIDPHLAWADPEAPAAVPQIGSASGYVTGPLIRNKLDFIASFDISRRTTATPSLLAPRATLLSQLGVSPDSLAAAMQAFAALGVPLGTTRVLLTPTVAKGSATIRADFYPNSFTALTFEAIPYWSHFTGLGVAELSLPTAAVEARSTAAWFKLDASTYFHRVLDDFHITLSPSRTSSSPFLPLPSGSVLVGTRFGDGRTGLTSFRFGGPGSGDFRATRNIVDAENEMSWATANTQHQLKFTQELRFDEGDDSQVADPAGAYTYQSLSDLTTNTPSSYSRALAATSHSYRATTGALSLGDIWRAIPGKLEFQGGVRYDWTGLNTPPAFNGVVDTLFGVRTDVVPADHGLSPRLGFLWSPAGRRDRGLPAGMTIILPGRGAAARGGLAPFDASGLSVMRPGSDIILTGGIGAYRGVISPARLGTLAGATGLSGTTRYLSCVGAATPSPDWTATNPPTECADGAGPAPYAAIAPRVTVFDPAFRAPVSWRGTLQISGLAIGSWALAPTITYALGVNSESWTDLNLQRTVSFGLPAEQNRPVYGSPADVVPQTGLFAPAASRISAAYGTVMQTQSDLRYHSLQLTVPIVPPKLFGNVPVYFVYSFNSQRAEQRGFSGTTAGDPFDIEWVAGQQPLHQFIVGVSDLHMWWFTTAVRFSVLSGAPYTPMVGQDINGDGLANDRAFVPRTTGADTALSTQMSALIAKAPAGARQCLAAQLGAIAADNSCRTPWQARLDLSIAFTPPQRLGFGSRLKMTATMLNAGGALVRLAGLENTSLGQSSSSLAVDSRLLDVTGFDPTKRTFTYRVNQLFGEPIDYGSARHRYPPFELQVGIEYRLGYPPTNPAARSLGLLHRGEDSKQMAAQVRAAILNRFFRVSPVAEILALRDSLGLTPEQVTSIQAVSQEFDRHVDSLIAPVVAFAMKRGKQLTTIELNQQTMAINSPLRDLQATERQKAVTFLVPEQRIKLTTLTRTP
ncbi:MAG: TonB-dependent receptor [Gemmatimonadales bacterium]